jgi:flagellar basal-body rod protein FlgB|tara:strand:- start:911 stop:1339 length:429 start_codon:yes stop_codon:yes gene_type:complete
LQYSNQAKQILEIVVKTIEGHLKVHAEALALRSQRNEILASNIANAATPNFKAKDLDFEQMLNSKMGFGKVNISNKRHFEMSIGPNEQGVKFRQNITPSMDGNTVELHVEQMQFSENVMKYQTSLEFLNRKISGLMSAIKGE